MTTGNVLPWNPNVNGTVCTILPSGNNVYLGGSFTAVGGAAHKNIAQVNNTTGAVVPAFANRLEAEQDGARDGACQRQPLHRRRVHQAAERTWPS